MYSVYDFPEVYDAVMQHSPEVIAAEVASIERLLAERGVARRHVLELACGTCPHVDGAGGQLDSTLSAICAIMSAHISSRGCFWTR